MVAILLAETNPNLEDIINEAEAMCHDVGLGVIVHYEGEDLEELLDLVESKIILFSPKGKLSIDEMISKYPEGDVLLVVGGFTDERELSQELKDRADDTVSLGNGFLTIPEVIGKIIDAYEKKAEGRGR